MLDVEAEGAGNIGQFVGSLVVDMLKANLIGLAFVVHEARQAHHTVEVEDAAGNVATANMAGTLTADYTPPGEPSGISGKGLFNK